MKEKNYISRKEQAVLTKKKIFDTTIYLIRKKGYSKITIREICQAAELSVGTFYLYFLSKDDVLLELFNQLNQTLSEAFPETDLSAEETLLVLVQHFFDQLEKAFDRELLTEIYRASISIKKDMLLSEGQPFYEMLSAAAEKIKPEPSADSSGSCALLQTVLLIIQGHLFQWLLAEQRSLSETKDSCAADLRKLLRI